MVKQYQLEADEQLLAEELQKGEWVLLEDQDQELSKLKASAKAHGNKLHRVNIRLTEWDYEKAQVKAMEEGIPFTTFIASIVHQFLKGKLAQV